MKETSRY